jgi:hypothetical protein
MMSLSTQRRVEVFTASSAEDADGPSLCSVWELLLLMVLSEVVTSLGSALKMSTPEVASAFRAE